MSTRHLTTLALSAALLAYPAYTLLAEEPAPTTPKIAATAATGFVSLFNGKDTTGWRNPYDFGEVSVVDGEIRLKADKKFFLCTEKEYTNFVFEAEVLLPADITSPEGKTVHPNSGFMFRAHVEPNKVYGYQAEVDGTARQWSGGLYDEGRRTWFISPKKPAPKATPEEIAAAEASQKAFRERAGDCLKRNDWNTYRITCSGKKLKIEVNGVTTTDVEDDVDAKGYLGIQHHGEKGAVYRFRNLRIKELP